MADPVTPVVFSFITAAFKLADFAAGFCQVGSENEVFVRTIQNVKRDLEETERLLTVASVKSSLISTPGKIPWIKDIILSTKRSLDDIGRWVDRARADKVGFGSVSFETRVRWVFNDREKMMVRRMELATCHQALSNALIYLAPLEKTASLPVSEPPMYDDATSFDDLLSPRQRRKVLYVRRDVESDGIIKESTLVERHDANTAA
jgi:hypothetical protein